MQIAQFVVKALTKHTSITQHWAMCVPLRFKYNNNNNNNKFHLFIVRKKKSKIKKKWVFFLKLNGDCRYGPF